MKVEEKLALNKFEIDREVHITVDESKCKECELTRLHICLPRRLLRHARRARDLFIRGLPGMRQLQVALRQGGHKVGQPARGLRHLLPVRIKPVLDQSGQRIDQGGKMNIIVCVKPVLEPDLPPIKFSINEKTNSVVAPEGIPPVMNPYDALAVEAALRLKEKKGGKITAVCIGEKSGEDVLRKATGHGRGRGNHHRPGVPQGIRRFHQGGPPGPGDQEDRGLRSRSVRPPVGRLGPWASPARSWRNTWTSRLSPGPRL